jgi:hypothetical protein
MPPKIGFTGRTRDLGIKGPSAGKGDKSRISDDAAYRRNFDEIDWSPTPAKGKDDGAYKNLPKYVAHSAAFHPL